MMERGINTSHKSLWSAFEGDANAAVLTHIAPQARSRCIPAFIGSAKAARDPKLHNQQANCRLNVSVAGFELRFRRPSIIAAGLGCLRGACRGYRLAASVRQEATQPTGDPSGPGGEEHLCSVWRQNWGSRGAASLASSASVQLGKNTDRRL